MAESGPSDNGIEHPIMLFDGVCYLCRGSVQFVLKRDPKARFHFAALQSGFGRAQLANTDLSDQQLSSVLLIADGQIYTKSTAALRIAQKLRGGWPLLSVFLIVPRPLRDWVYDFIGDRRYRWFGKMDACWVPDQNMRDRFLD